MSIALTGIHTLSRETSPEQALTTKLRGKVEHKTCKEDASQAWLLPLNAILFQLLGIAILFSLAGYAGAATNNYAAETESAKWMQLAALVEDEKRPLLHLDSRNTKDSWALAFDNDILAPGHRDRDYTYGLNFTYTGASLRDMEAKAPLDYVDQLFGLKDLPSKRDSYSFEAGVFGFTPSLITQKLPNPNDRPYASLVYVSSSHEQVDSDHNLAWKTSFTLGALGLNLAGELQNIAHDQIGGKEALGWDNQISQGGEVTARYLVARQHYWESASDSAEIKSTLQASIGYLTEASWSLSFRHGKIYTPWSSFNPELISYGEKSTYSSNAEPTNEHYFWAGATLKARAYNAFLQGQFRDSNVTYDHGELRPLVLEGWAGYTCAIKEGYRFSYVLRGQTSEIKKGEGNRNVLWGGLILAKVI